MTEILFSTTAFLQMLGMDEVTAFWVTAGVVGAAALLLIVGIAINIGTREQEGETE